MTVEDVLREISGRIRGFIPPSIDVSDVEFEGALLVIYTTTPEKFAENKNLVKQLAKMLQKRIVVRPDPSVVTDVETAEKKIREIIYAAGFQINHKKSALLTLEKGPIFINGIGIRQDWTLFLPRRILNKIRGLIHLSLSRRARDVWKKVEGYVAFFKYITKSRPKTQTEKKLLKLYYKAKPIFSVS